MRKKHQQIGLWLSANWYYFVNNEKGPPIGQPFFLDH
mgnify:CR=1 FL=1|jgi:hypothetical protein